MGGLDCGAHSHQTKSGHNSKREGQRDWGTKICSLRDQNVTRILLGRRRRLRLLPGVSRDVVSPTLISCDTDFTAFVF